MAESYRKYVESVQAAPAGVPKVGKTLGLPVLKEGAFTGKISESNVYRPPRGAAKRPKARRNPQ